MFVSNNSISFHKHQKVSKYYEKDCRTILPLRIERLILGLKSKEPKITHTRRNENISDYSNRHSLAHA